MAIYSPTRIYPEGISINAATPLVLTWEYNGDGAEATQTDYQVQIYDLSNVSKYDSTKLTSANEYHTISSTPLTNGNPYKMKISTWSGASTASSKWVLFYANSPATLTLTATPSTQQYFNFSATYAQAENVPLLTYEANLYLTATPTVAIDTSGIIYPTTLIGDGDTISYAFDGLEDGGNYSVEFTGTTQRGEVITTGLIPFSTSYSYPPNISELTVTANNTDGTIELDWLKLKQILGTVNGTYSYVDGKFTKGLQLDAGSALYYDTETIPDDSTLYFWVKLPTNYNGTLVRFGDTANGMRVFYDGERFGFQHGDYITVGRKLINTEAKQYVIDQFKAIVGESNIKRMTFFDETSGKVLTDEMGNGDGLLSVDASLLDPATVYSANVLNFNSSGDYWEFADADDLSFGNGTTDSTFSIVSCINPNAMSAHDIVAKRDDTTGSIRREYAFLFNSGILTFRLYDDSANANICRTYNTDISSYIGSYKTYTATYNGGGMSGMRMYIGNSRVDDTNSFSGTYVAMENGPSKVGNYNLNGSGAKAQVGSYKGAFLAILSCELTQQQVTQINTLLSDYVSKKNYIIDDLSDEFVLIGVKYRKIIIKTAHNTEIIST